MMVENILTAVVDASFGNMIGTLELMAIAIAIMAIPFALYDVFRKKA